MEIHTAIGELEPIAHWNPQVLAFLQRPSTLSCIQYIISESGKSPKEAVLVLLAAMRYLDIRSDSPDQVRSLLEDPPGTINYDLFLVRHHHELVHLGIHQHVQANVLARCLPIMEVLGSLDHKAPFTLIELGCAAGILGQALRRPLSLQGSFASYFPPHQQVPKTWQGIDHYLGYDLTIPNISWVLACMGTVADRERTARFVADQKETIPNWVVKRGSALHFPDLPDFALPPQTTPIVLTSFMLYQLSPAQQVHVSSRIMDFIQEHHGHWINLDVILETTGKLGFYLFLDSHQVYEFPDDYCQTWQAYQERKTP